jgi:hypothetical protein
MQAGESLLAICQDEGMPSTNTVYRWLVEKDKPEFRDKYARAREIQADTLAAEILQIADDGKNDTYTDAEGNVRVDYDNINRSRLRVDARKWYASKLAPKKYGDRIQQEVSGPDGNAVQVQFIIPDNGRDNTPAI